jgi:pentatricopeptide repeat protein
VALWQQAKKDNTVTGKAHHVIFKEAVRRGQLDESREAFVDVKSESIDIDKSTYSKLIQVYARAHAVRDAEAVMAEMEEDGLDVPQDAIEAMMIACVHPKSKNKSGRYTNALGAKQIYGNA